MRNFCGALFFLFHFSSIQAQSFINPEAGEKLAFINHLIRIDAYEDAIYMINQMDSNCTAEFDDTLHYLKAWAFYHLQELDSSSFYFDRVSPQSSQYYKSVFFSTYDRAYKGDFETGISKLSALSLKDSNLLRLQNFELAGYSLLKRDFQNFETYAKKFDYRFYANASEEKKMNDHYKNLLEYKKKSPFVAGALSALVPGLGKIYAGRIGEGFSAFFVIGSLGLVTFENWRKDGLLDPKTLFFGSILTTYYIGNIWGSVFSVKIEQQEFNDAVNQYILFDLHIPLRNVFN